MSKKTIYFKTMKIFKFPKGKQKCHVSHRFRLESDRCRLSAMADRAVTFDPATKLPPAFVLLGRRPLASSRLFCWDKYIKTTHFIFLDQFFKKKYLNNFSMFELLHLFWLTKPPLMGGMEEKRQLYQFGASRGSGECQTWNSSQWNATVERQRFRPRMEIRWLAELLAPTTSLLVLLLLQNNGPHVPPSQHLSLRWSVTLQQITRRLFQVERTFVLKKKFSPNKSAFRT